MMLGITMPNPPPSRRTVLKTLGAGIVGGVAITSSASAHPAKNNGQILVLPTWGDGDIYEIMDAEPIRRDRMQDSEGNESAHEPLYVIKSLGGSGVAGSEHSPMFHGADHTVPVPGGSAKRFSAQWHPKAVVDKNQMFIPTPDGPMPNLVNRDQHNNPLTSALAIENATNVAILPAPEEAVFTCPVRPHHHRGPND